MIKKNNWCTMKSSTSLTTCEKGAAPDAGVSQEPAVEATGEVLKSALDFTHDKPPSASLIDFNPLEFGSEFTLPLDNIYLSTADPLSLWNPILSPNPNSIVCTLRAPTSPLQIVDDATLTYLNQGQTYHIAISESLSNVSSAANATTASADASPTTVSSGSSRLIRTAISLRLQQGKVITESEPHFSTWVSSNADRNILEIDKLASTGISDVRGLPAFGGVLFAWDQHEGCCASFRINCLSTDFAAHRRGGEKGAYLRLQLDSALVDDKARSCRIVDSCSCLIKVFKGAGAERRLKLDHDKVLKATAAEHTSASGSNGESSSSGGDRIAETILLPCTKGVSKPLPISAFGGDVTDVAGDVKRIKLEPGVSTTTRATPTRTDTKHTIATPLTSNLETPPHAQAHTRASGVLTTDDSRASKRACPSSDPEGTVAVQPETNEEKTTVNVSDDDVLTKKRGTSSAVREPIANSAAEQRSSDAVGVGRVSGAKSHDSATTMPCAEEVEETSTGKGAASGRDHGMPKSLARLRLDNDDDGESDDDNGRTARPRVALQVTEHSSTSDVQQWLTENHFADCKAHFKSYNGHLLLKLEKEDFVQICSAAEGIRMYTTLRYGRDADTAAHRREQRTDAPLPLSVTTYTQTESPPPAERHAT
eukprot:m.474863 g.474863  ORF g.474863 m.474863 type:complete len:651 (-) comp21684_c1_seq1:192-2144(-)